MHALSPVWRLEVGNLLSDLRRVNVAITRAKQKLIMVGSPSTLRCPSGVVGPLLDIVTHQQWVRASYY